MKRFTLGFLVLLFALSVSAQPPRLDTALAKAKTEHKNLLLRFSGSDWCIPCIRMEKSIFSDAGFHQYADSALVLVQADFPRTKKHRLPEELRKENDALAARFNPDGAFPLLVLLSPEGNVLRRWEGFVADKPAEFIVQLKKSNTALPRSGHQ